VQTKIEEQDRSYPLIQTKLFIPPLRPKLVQRTHLIEKLNRTAYCKLTLISAPAGFGKTTLLSEWISDREIPVGWISLDKGDNDPVQFIHYLVGALQSIDETIGEATLTMLRNPQRPPIGSIMANLIRDIADICNDCVLVLDDYHAIDTKEIHHIVESLLDYLPGKMRLVLATRVDPPLPLARLRGRNQMTELRVFDLSFTHDETVVFFNKMMSMGLTKQEIAILESRTEGWIAGLQLAALSMQGHKDISTFINDFAGDERHIVDYLAEEVLNLQPEHVQDFLLQTSIVNRLSGPLCDFLVGRKGSQKILDELERANLFILPLDNKRCWYRYHHLFNELLYNRLHQENPDLIPDLHLRAASWFEANGYIQDAVKHALRHPDLNRAAELIDRHAFKMLYSGEVQKMLEWFASLTEASIRSHPRLWIVKAWAMALMQREDLREEIENLLQQAENYLIESKADNDRVKILHGHAASIRALVMQSPFAHGHDPEKLIGLAQRAQTLLPEDDYAIRSANTLHVGFGHLELGNTQKAEDAFKQSYQQGIKGGNFYAAVYGPINRAWIAFHLGRLDRMMKICQNSLDEINRLVADADHHLPIVGGLHILLGAAWFEQNKLEQAEEALTYGLRLIKWTGEYEMHISGYTTLACLLYCQRRHNAAEEAIVALERSWPDGRFYTDALRMRLHFYEDLPTADAIVKVQAWIEDVRKNVLSIDGDLRLVPWNVARQFQLLTWFRLNIALASVGRAMEKLPSIMDRIVDLKNEADKHGFIKYFIELSLLESMTHVTMGENDKALLSMKNAVNHGAQGGFIRIFVDGGLNIPNLLEKILDTRVDVPRAYIKKLLSAFRLNKLIKTGDGLVERLSERELEVLRLIAAGLSNKKITEELFISMSTVKTHLRNIYSKLNVHSRTEAMASAKDLGLL
jgi:LuxR family maltose regulon positive regulatory protein